MRSTRPTMAFMVPSRNFRELRPGDLGNLKFPQTTGVCRGERAQTVHLNLALNGKDAMKLME